MKWSKLAVLFGALVTVLPGISVNADAAPSATAAAGAHSGRRAGVGAEIKSLRGDIRAIRMAHQGRDKAGVQAGLSQLKNDWQALPSKVQERIQEKHPKLFKRLRKHLNQRAGHKKSAAQ